jgi:glutathione synthase/RimK-type ligase-like ATP-grasp enzyme
MKVLGVYREQVFSPGKVHEDAAILDATLGELSLSNYEICTQKAEALETPTFRPVCVLSMAQSGRALRILEDWHRGGIRIINSVQSVRNTYRKPMIRLLADAGVPIPISRIFPVEEAVSAVPFGSSTRYWLKRGDVHAVQKADVVRVASRQELIRALDHFRRQEIASVLIQEEVEGQVVKFYGVGPGAYFSAFLPSSGKEVTSRMEQIQPIVQQSAEALGLEIFGGDAIITGQGRMLLIDFNDWPSFSRCCRTAAKQIAGYIERICDGGSNGASRGESGASRGDLV